MPTERKMTDQCQVLKIEANIDCDDNKIRNDDLLTSRCPKTTVPLHALTESTQSSLQESDLLSHVRSKLA